MGLQSTFFESFGGLPEVCVRAFGPLQDLRELGFRGLGFRVSRRLMQNELPRHDENLCALHGIGTIIWRIMQTKIEKLTIRPAT